MSYQLVNVEERAASAPDTFENFPRSERESLQVGNLAKLIFDDRERMWVKITEVKDGRYKGTLGNSPAFVDLQFGEEVEFGPENISDIMRSV
jgi:uncharacterized protein YegJ (DUF2314 family)